MMHSNQAVVSEEVPSIRFLLFLFLFIFCLPCFELNLS